MSQTVFEFEISFDYKIITKTFTRWAKTEREAVEDARHGFQAVYGYWPGVYTAVRTGREMKR